MMTDFSFTGHATTAHDIGSVEYAKHVAGPDGRASMTCAGIDGWAPVLSAMGYPTTTDLPYRAIAKLVLPAGKMTDPAAVLPLAEWVITPAAFQRIAPKLADFISKEPATRSTRSGSTWHAPCWRPRSIRRPSSR